MNSVLLQPETSESKPIHSILAEPQFQLQAQHL